VVHNYSDKTQSKRGNTTIIQTKHNLKEETSDYITSWGILWCDCCVGAADVINSWKKEWHM